MTRRLARGVQWLAGLAVGAAAGYGCNWLHTPIPWMLGPLISLALLRLLGVPIEAPPGARQIGQWVIGTSLGLYFSPQVVRDVAGWWPLLVAGALFAVASGYCGGLALARLAGIDRTTALFASVPAGAAEMAVLGERFGAQVDRVAAAQSLRMLVVAIVVPFAYTFLGAHGGDRYVPGTTALDGASRFIGAVVTTVLGAIVAAALFGGLLAWISGLSIYTLALGLAPGGVAEMCITAKALQLGVPLVTAFHVTRVVALLLLTAPLFAAVQRWRRR